MSRRKFERIKKRRTDLGRRVRFTYFGDIQTLIIKLPTEVHERAHLNFGQLILKKAIEMGIDYDQFYGIGATKYVGQARQSASTKEGDSSWKNLRIRSEIGDWPSLVIEAGLSESLPRLRSDARWWIAHSGGRMNIVLLIWIRPATKTVKIEKWESTATADQSIAVPTAEITIQSNSTVTGAPLDSRIWQDFRSPSRSSCRG